MSMRHTILRSGIGTPRVVGGDKYLCCALSLCRSLAMNVHAVRNLTGWYGYSLCCGVMINGHVVHHPRVVVW